MGTNSGGDCSCDSTAARRAGCAPSSRTACARRSAPGRLAADARLPPSRSLAADLGVSRRLVVDAYAQLLAEGYLTRARGRRHVRGRGRPSAAAAPAVGAGPRALRFDFFPGNPDLAAFPRRAWLRALREVLREAPDRALGYPDPRGAPELRRALAGHLRRVRGVVADEGTVSCAAGRGAGARAARGRARGAGVAVEDPGLPLHRAILRRRRARCWRCRWTSTARAWRRSSRCFPAAVLVTPAHQSPTGVALSPGRRAACSSWARAREALVIEDDYDAEFRYDRPPLGRAAGAGPRPRGVHGHGQQDARAGAAARLDGAARAAGRRRRRAASASPTTARRRSTSSRSRG